jgi:hypothetical protein
MCVFALIWKGWGLVFKSLSVCLYVCLSVCLSPLNCGCWPHPVSMTQRLFGKEGGGHKGVLGPWGVTRMQLNLLNSVSLPDLAAQHSQTETMYVCQDQRRSSLGSQGGLEPVRSEATCSMYNFNARAKCIIKMTPTSLLIGFFMAVY